MYDPSRARPARRTGGLRTFCILCAAGLLLAPGLGAQTPDKKNAPDLLHQFSSSLEALAKRVSPSVVQVLATGYGPLEEGSRSETGLVIGRQRAIGSGVIVDSDGYIVTNAHVVTGAQRVQVVVPSPVEDSGIRSLLSARGYTLEARVLGLSREIDLALLKIEAKGLPALPIGRYSNLRQGELVFAFGSPEGLRNSVTMGVVSSVARQPNLDSPMVYIQTDAPINPGNSGGPLVNVDGELVGINTFILTQSGGNEGLGFAIPSGVVAFAYPQLRKYGHVHRGEIAASVQTITPTLAAGLGLARDYGVIVSDVLPGGSADEAGLKIQDIILSVDGRPTDSLPVFGLSFYLHRAGERAKFEVLRGSERLLLEIRMIERPHDVDRFLETVGPEKNLVRRLGILGIELNPKLAQMFQNLRKSAGVIVAARVANSGGTENSLVTGDVIHAVNGTPVTSLEGLRSALDALKPDSSVVLQIERDGKLMYATLQMQGE